MLGIAQELEVGLGLGIERDAAASRRSSRTRCGCAPRRDSGDRRAQFLDRHRRAPQPEARRDRRRGRRARTGRPAAARSTSARGVEREADIGEDVEREAPHHAVHQRRQVEPEQRLRPQQRDAPRPFAQQRGGDDAGIGEARQQQRVGPDQDADRHAGDGAARGRAPPDQPAEERRRELRDGGERQQADRGELRVAGRAVVEVGEEQDDEDRDAPHRQQQRADVGALGDQPLAPLEHQRHDDVVRHHDRERDRLHDHHGGRGRQSADERDQRQQLGVRPTAAAPARTCRCRRCRPGTSACRRARSARTNRLISTR